MRDVVVRSRTAARGVVIAMCAAFCAVVPILLGHRSVWAMALAVWVLPIAAIAALVASYVLLRIGSGAPSTLPLFGGCLFILGGVVFDVAATAYFTPDLSLEQNVIARLLLDSGVGVSSVYLYGGILQLLLVACMCVLWIAFLRHRNTFVSSSFSLGSSSFRAFLKATTGGGELTWRQWIFPLSWAEMPTVYHLVWLTAPLIMAGAAHRWHLGFQWVGVTRHIAPAASVGGTSLVALAIYVGWLYREYRARVDDAKTGTGLPSPTNKA